MESALLPQVEDFPDAEERRLLYVALTRACAGLAAFNKDNPSRFVEALKQLDVPVARKPKARAVQHPARVAFISGARPDNAHNPE